MVAWVKCFNPSSLIIPMHDKLATWKRIVENQIKVHVYGNTFMYLSIFTGIPQLMTITEPKMSPRFWQLKASCCKCSMQKSCLDFGTNLFQLSHRTQRSPLGRQQQLVSFPAVFPVDFLPQQGRFQMAII